jgi:hypothetical protein
VNAFNRRFLLIKTFLQNLVLRPTATAPFSIFFNIQAATMKRFSYNTTGLSPVLKKPHPTTKGQDKTKEGTKQEQPWLVQRSKKNNKQLEKTTTNNKNYKQQLLKTYSSTVSSVGPSSLFAERRASTRSGIGSSNRRRYHQHLPICP